MIDNIWLGRTSAPTVLYVATVAVVGVGAFEPPESPPLNNAMPAPMVASAAPVVMPAVAQENVFLPKSGQISGLFLRNSLFSQLLFMDTA